MAAAVRAAGFLHALCGASAGESLDAGSRSFEPSGSGGAGGGGSPGACTRPGEKKQEAAPDCRLTGVCFVTLRAFAPFLGLRAWVCKVRMDWTRSRVLSSSPDGSLHARLSEEDSSKAA